jgi:hypothetical protein
MRCHDNGLFNGPHNRSQIDRNVASNATLSLWIEPPHLRNMLKRPNGPDTVTLSGDPLERAQQVLDVARHQIRLGQNQTDNYHVEDALNDAEEAVDTARAEVGNAVEAIRDEEEESRAAERKRQKWRPVYRPA